MKWTRGKKIIVVALLVLSVGIFGTLSVAGYAVYRFVHPVPHQFHDEPTVPPEAQGMISHFYLPEDVTHVYYFSNRQLFIGEYLRVTLLETAFDTYRDQLLKDYNGKIVKTVPEVVAEDMEAIREWWPQRITSDMTIVDVFGGDHIAVLDAASHIVYALRQDG